MTNRFENDSEDDLVFAERYARDAARRAALEGRDDDAESMRERARAARGELRERRPSVDCPDMRETGCGREACLCIDPTRPTLDARVFLVPTFGGLVEVVGVFS